jgi:hypothetical protein
MQEHKETYDEVILLGTVLGDEEYGVQIVLLYSNDGTNLKVSSYEWRKW